MALPSNEPTPELTIERVRGGRRAALVVVGLAVVVVGALVWKPWDTHSPPPVLPSTLPAAFLPTPTPLADTPEPTDADNGQQVVDAPDNLGSVMFYPNEGPAGWCIYKAADTNETLTLSVIVVEPPVVIVGDSADPTLRAVRWHVELETNTQDKLFESEWSHESDSEAKAIDVDQFGFVKPITVTVPAASSVTLFRAPMIIDWLGHAPTVLATQRVLPATYGVLGAPGSPTQSEGCLASI